MKVGLYFASKAVKVQLVDDVVSVVDELKPDYFRRQKAVYPK